MYKSTIGKRHPQNYWTNMINTYKQINSRTGQNLEKETGKHIVNLPYKCNPNFVL